MNEMCGESGELPNVCNICIPSRDESVILFKLCIAIVVASNRVTKTSVAVVVAVVTQIAIIMHVEKWHTHEKWRRKRTIFDHRRKNCFNCRKNWLHKFIHVRIVINKISSVRYFVGFVT